MIEPVRLVEEHRYDPPRPVELEQNGHWWPRLQPSWRLLNDRRGWLAGVEYAVAYEWGHGKHLGLLTADRVRVT